MRLIETPFGQDASLCCCTCYDLGGHYCSPAGLSPLHRDILPARSANHLSFLFRWEDVGPVYLQAMDALHQVATPSPTPEHTQTL